MPVEFRKIFDTIPERFDRFRPRYSEELFADLIGRTELDESKSVLELGPGTGQATEPILRTGCDYHAIELGENLAKVMVRNFRHYPNFQITVDDFITHDFGEERFDMILSAATIQWIPEEIAFSKCFQLLKPGGTLAMLLTRSDYRTPNEALYADIQKVYGEHFVTAERYKGGFQYGNCIQYGFVDFETREFSGRRELTADEYVSFSGTHCDHITLVPEHREAFFEGLRKAVLDHGNKLVFLDTHVLMTARKP